MKVLITGGKGFIGSYISKYFENPIIVDNLRTSKSNDNDFYNIDLTKKSELFNSLVEQSDIVIHLASSVGVKDVSNGSGPFWNSHNINKNVLDACLEFNKKIIFMSSSEVYGSGYNISEENNFNILNNPRSSYAIEKLSMETMIQFSGLDYLIIRPFNITGKGQLPDYGMVLPRFIEAAKNNKDIEVYSKYAVRSFCDVRDFSRILSTLIKVKERGIFNIGNPSNAISMIQLANRIKSMLESKSNIKCIKFKDVYKNFEDIQVRTPNIDKLSYFGLEPEYNLNDIIRSFEN